MAAGKHRLSPAVPLGTGTLPAGCGNKAALLHRAAARGLPVPAGVVVPHAVWQQFGRDGDPRAAAHALHETLNLSDLGDAVAVRSAFSAEDTADRSLAGYFETILHVDPDNPTTLAAALTAVWASADRAPVDNREQLRRDVLIMRMVAAEHAGVAFTQTDFTDDLINYTSGTADGLVGGAEEGARLRLPKREAPPHEGPPFARRLQTLLTDTRRVFGDGDWDIEWADDGRTCWLVQIRPITRPPRRNEAFTYANIREIMPDPPSRFMTSIVADSAPRLYGYYRGFDSTLPADRPMIELFAHRPFFNLSLLTETMRHWGLPTALVTNSIGGDDETRSFGLDLTQLLCKTPVLLRQGWAQATAVRSAQRATDDILARTQRPLPTFTACVETGRWLFARLVTEMFNLTAALSAPLLILRLTNTLPQHNARHHAISTAMYTDLEPLRRLVRDRPTLAQDLKHGRLPDDPAFHRLWTAYLRKHGHRGIYESDLARPRYHEEPTPLLHSLTPGPSRQKNTPPRTLMGVLTLPVWWQCRRVLNAREWWRYNAMRCFDRLRGRLLTLAETAVQAGQLPTAEHLWRLESDEVCRLDDGWTPPADFWHTRAAEIEDAHRYNLPDLVRRFDDLESYRRDRPHEAGVAPDRYSGVSLTTGTVSGRAWVLSQPATQLPDGFDPAETILVARSVDAGWIPTFSRVAAAAVEIGGDLSHGSIILREIGLPAVTNVRGLTTHIRTGDRITVRADSGRVETLKR